MCLGVGLCRGPCRGFVSRNCVAELFFRGLQKGRGFLGTSPFSKAAFLANPYRVGYWEKSWKCDFSVIFRFPFLPQTLSQLLAAAPPMGLRAECLFGGYLSLTRAVHVTLLQE